MSTTRAVAALDVSLIHEDGEGLADVVFLASHAGLDVVEGHLAAACGEHLVDAAHEYGRPELAGAPLGDCDVKQHPGGEGNFVVAVQPSAAVFGDCELGCPVFD